jgi:hypothetical protein
VHNPEAVGLCRADAGLKNEINGLFDRKSAPLREPRCEIASFQELHDHERYPAGQGSYVEHPRDVLALDLDGGLRLPQKPIDRARVARHLGQEELDRDLLIEAHVVRRHDDAHSSESEHAIHSVLTGDYVALP